MTDETTPKWSTIFHAGLFLALLHIGGMLSTLVVIQGMERSILITICFFLLDYILIRPSFEMLLALTSLFFLATFLTPTF